VTPKAEGGEEVNVDLLGNRKSKLKIIPLLCIVSSIRRTNLSLALNTYASNYCDNAEQYEHYTEPLPTAKTYFLCPMLGSSVTLAF
jgi:hypothetical protein